MTTRYGIIGCGMMGQEHLRNIRLQPDAAVAAIYEPNAEMAERAAQFAPDAAFVAGLDALLGRTDLDCLVIASPNFRHVEQLERIAARVSLPILCEKPLYTDPADERRVRALAETYKAPIWVGMEYRYMPPMAALIERAPGVTGGIRMLSIVEHRHAFLQKVDNWNRFNDLSGGTLVEKCCHFFDLMRHILKAEPVRIAATAGQAANHLDEVYDGRRSDIWDHGYVIVDFEGGARAMLELCMFAEGSRYQEVVSAIGADGRIECAVPGPPSLWREELGPEPVARLDVVPRDRRGMRSVEMPLDAAVAAAGGHYGSTFFEHRKFLEVVRGRGEVEVGLHDGLAAVRMGLAAQEAARTGTVVAL